MRPSGLFSAVVIRALLVVLILVASFAVINYVMYRTSSFGQSEIRDENFKALLKTGEKQVKSSEYREAIETFRSAEKTIQGADQGEFAALQKSREKLARVGGAIGAEAYGDMANAAIREGKMLEPDGEAALPRFQNAERFALLMSGEQKNALVEARDGQSRCFVRLKRYAEAASAHERMLDYLRTTGDPDDLAIAAEYFAEAEVYGLANEWGRAEEAAQQASSAADRSIARANGDAQLLADANTQKSNAVEALVNIYWHQQKTDLALSTADVFYTQNMQFPEFANGGRGMSRDRLVHLALDIAQRSDRREDVKVWEERMGIRR